MEREYLYKVYYGEVLVKTVVAHSRWEAVEKVYSKYIDDYPNLKRSLFKADAITK